MNESSRQAWLGIVFDLMVEYHDAQCYVAQNINDAPWSDEVIRPMCERVAAVVGGGATAEFVYETFLNRLKVDAE